MSYLIIIILILLIIGFIFIYNTLIKLRNKVDNSWSQIDVQLQRRFDLIPNFLNVVKGYMNYEQETFSKITQLRTELANTKNITEKMNLNNQLSLSLKNIIAVSENYPELKADKSFQQLSQELANTENKISFSRQFYNDSVTKYNTQIQIFPSNIIANIMGFTSRELFKVENDTVRENVKADF